jgi:hypothetical protein
VPDQRAKAQQNLALDRHALALGSGWHQPGGLVEHRGQALRPGPKEIVDVRVGLSECEHVVLRVGVAFDKRGFRFDFHQWLHVLTTRAASQILGDERDVDRDRLHSARPATSSGALARHGTWRW